MASSSACFASRSLFFRSASYYFFSFSARFYSRSSFSSSASTNFQIDVASGRSSTRIPRSGSCSSRSTSHACRMALVSPFLAIAFKSLLNFVMMSIRGSVISLTGLSYSSPKQFRMYFRYVLIRLRSSALGSSVLR